MTAMKSELCVCGHDAAVHDLSHCVVEATGCAGACGMCEKDACDHFDPAHVAPEPEKRKGATVDGKPLDLKNGEFYRSGRVRIPIDSPVPGHSAALEFEGSLRADFPKHCQGDWPDAFPFTTTGTYMLPDGGEVVLSYTGIINMKDLEDKIPARPIEPLQEGPGSVPRLENRCQEGMCSCEGHPPLVVMPPPCACGSLWHTECDIRREPEEPSPLVAAPDYLNHPDWGKLIPLPCDPPCENETEPNAEMKRRAKSSWLSDIEGCL